MTAFVRRAGAAILKLLSSVADPTQITTAVQVYARTLSNVTQIFAEDSDGIIYQVTPFLGPEATSYYSLDDFLTSNASAVTNAGGGSTVFTASDQASPGIATATITTLNQRTTLLPSNSPVSTIVPGGGSPLFWEGRSRTNTAQDASDMWSDRMGIGDSTNAADATEGIYFESNRNVNGDNNMRLCSANGGTRTKTTMGVAPTIGSFERWKWICNGAATSIQGYLNDVATGSPVTTNIATTNGTGAWWSQLIKLVGNTARTIDRDYFETYQLFNSPR